MEARLRQALWYFAKAFQMLGLALTLWGILTGLSDPLGEAAFKAETRLAVTGVLVFGTGWLMEKIFSK
ncbi:MAG: hypothetical protein ONB48_21055 [candidate division KSB1 bacterium]|nr:hypothetical protein [candidate division KSB1 bacterium]MDZ7288138.1 hypothetical protein [candidate division KSB1 bacterium]MDZ7300349.1 hypothetical protein [candidate division KSB1 bacterium]MDZ7306162.1 hypothetical protein [candidate division KSB1 bacterium]MDZ7351349.1 hypothetical protein [candidate division KSB1 bacterium]